MSDAKPPHPPKRPSGSFAAVPVAVTPSAIPHRPNTQTLRAVGAETQDVLAAENAIAALVMIQPEAIRGVREALLRLALSKFHEGEDSRSHVLESHSLALRSVYWRASEDTARRDGPNARPTFASVITTLRTDDSIARDLPERDVRAILRLFGLPFIE